MGVKAQSFLALTLVVFIDLKSIFKKINPLIFFVT